MDSVLISVIGNRGSGKNTFLAYLALLYEQFYPWVKVYSNFPIVWKTSEFCDDILKKIAEFLVYKDYTPGLVLIDEGALSGFESRGSGSTARAVDSYLITLSRKTNKHY